jgi:hypothetical protein
MITATQIVTILLTLTRYQRSLLQDIFRASGSDDALTVSWCHKQRDVEEAFCALGRMGLIECEGSDWNWERAWAHPSNLARELFCLEAWPENCSAWRIPMDAAGPSSHGTPGIAGWWSGSSFPSSWNHAPTTIISTPSLDSLIYDATIRL